MTSNKITAKTINNGLKLARRMTGTFGAYETNERAFNLREDARAAGVGVIAIVDKIKADNVPTIDAAHDTATRDAIIADHWRGFSAAAVNHSASAHQFFIDACLSFDAASDRDSVAYAALQTSRKASLKDVAEYIAEWPEEERGDVSAIVNELTDVRASAMVKTSDPKTSKSVNVDKSDDADDISAEDAADETISSAEAELTFHEHLAAATALVDTLALDKEEANELAREIRALAKLVAAIAE